MTPDPYAHVPPVAADAEPDEHWRELRGVNSLPESYLPLAMPGDHPGWMHVASWILIVVFLTATGLGVCLTYGPGNG